MTPEPLDHISRPPLPWRDPELTECGRPLADVAQVVDRDTVKAKVKRDGQARAAYTTCMTCVQTSDRHTRPLTPLAAAVQREVGRVTWRSLRPGEPEPLIERELRAIGQLIERNRAEFDALTAVDEVGARRRAAADAPRRLR